MNTITANYADHSSERAAFLQVVTILGLSSVFILSLMYVTIPLIPVWAATYHVAQNIAVWTGSAFGFAYAIGNVFWGTLSDRFSRIRILYTGLFMLTAVTLLVGISPSLGALIALRSVEGVVAASFPAVAIAYVGDVLAPRYRAVTISVISCGFLLAGVLGQIYASSLEQTLGWRSVFEILAACYLVLAFAMTKLPKSLVSANAGKSLGAVYGQMLRLFRNGRLVIVWLVAVTILLSFVAMFSALTTYVSEHFNGGASDITLIRVAGIPSILLSINAGSLIKRIGSKKVVIGGLLIAAAGILLEAFSGSMLLLILTSALFILGIASAVPGMIVLVGQLGSQARGGGGGATAVYACFVFIGASLGPLLVNQLIGHGASLVFIVLGILLFAAAAVIKLFIRSPQA